MLHTRRNLVGMTVIALSALTLLSAAPASAQGGVGKARGAGAVSPAVSAVGPTIIGFESDFGGTVPEPITSLDNPTVHFLSTGGDDLWIDDFGNQSNGKGMAVPELGTPGAGLEIRFDVPTRRLSILFGNDDPVMAVLGDRATLRVYRGATLVATRTVPMNLNDDADQVVTYKGQTPITRATFVYAGAPAVDTVFEIVDDITLAQVCGIRGNSGPNRLVGTAKPNGICGLGGADRLLGRGGNDVLNGGRGRDRIIGGSGNDLLVGGAAGDTLRSADGVEGNDTVYGGPGVDTCIIDLGDTSHSCENLIVPK